VSRFCPQCGNPNAPDARYCVECRAPVTASAAIVPVAVVSRTANEQADPITAVAGRIGCKLLVGFIIFKIVVVVELLVICVLLVWSLGVLK
jgi:uncharacterized membrane protein YvbJ